MRYNIRLAGPYWELYEQFKAEGHNVALVTDAGEIAVDRPSIWDRGYGWSSTNMNELLHGIYVTLWDGKAATTAFGNWVADQNERKLLVTLLDK